MGGGFEIPLGWKNRIKRPFKSDVIFFFLFQFLFTRKGFSLKHEKNLLCKSAEIFIPYVWNGSMFNQFFTLLSRPGKAEWTTICLFKMLRWGFFSTFILGFVCGWILAKETFDERWVKFELKQVESKRIEWKLVR